MEIVLTGPNSKLFDELVRVLNAYKGVLAKEALTEDLPASLKETIRFEQMKEAAKSTYRVHQRDGLKGSSKFVVKGFGSSCVNILYSPIIFTKSVKNETMSMIKRFKEIEGEKERLAFILENFSYLASRELLTILICTIQKSTKIRSFHSKIWYELYECSTL